MNFKFGYEGARLKWEINPYRTEREAHYKGQANSPAEEKKMASERVMNVKSFQVLPV